MNEFKISNDVSKQRQIKNVIEKKRLQMKKSIFEVEDKEKSFLQNSIPNPKKFSKKQTFLLKNLIF